jgi:hypothetical protein
VDEQEGQTGSSTSRALLLGRRGGVPFRAGAARAVACLQKGHANKQLRIRSDSGIRSGGGGGVGEKCPPTFHEVGGPLCTPCCKVHRLQKQSTPTLQGWEVPLAYPIRGDVGRPGQWTCIVACAPGPPNGTVDCPQAF